MIFPVKKKFEALFFGLALLILYSLFKNIQGYFSYCGFTPKLYFCFAEIKITTWQRGSRHLK
jgi:hypothetical protein